MKTEEEAKQWIIDLGRQGKTYHEVCEITGYADSQIAKIWPVVMDFRSQRKPKEPDLFDIMREEKIKKGEPLNLFTMNVNDEIRQFLSQELNRKLDDQTLTWVDRDLFEYRLANILWKNLVDCPDRNDLMDAIMSKMFD